MCSTAVPYTESRLAHLVQNKCVGFPVVEHLRGVLGNKCAGQHNLKTVEIREMMWK